jgi:replicative DNA helicase
MSLVSKAMIPLRKVLGCALVVGAQLSRSSESERREPTRTDFRDAGGIEEDAHRCLALWRKPGQALDMEYFDTDLLQLKLRDGPLAHVPLRFHGRTTRFMEAAI